MSERAPFAVETVLAPVDGSDESARAADYAVAIADRYDATLHALFVVGREVILGMDAGAVEETDVADTATAFLDEVTDRASAHDIVVRTSTAHGFSPARKRHHPGTVVLDAADELGADLIVIPRESTTDHSAEALEKAAEYVLSYASQPVLSV